MPALIDMLLQHRASITPSHVRQTRTTLHPPLHHTATLESTLEQHTASRVLVLNHRRQITRVQLYQVLQSINGRGERYVPCCMCGMGFAAHMLPG